MKYISLYCLLFVALTTCDLQADFTIDSYDVGESLTRFTVGTSMQTTFDGSILGGERDDWLTLTDLGGDEFFGVIGFTGELDVAQGSTDQISGQVVYDNFGSLDFTEGGTSDSFLLGFISSDFDADLDNVISLTVSSGISDATHFVTVPANSTLPQDILVNFSNFGGVDMTAVDSVSLNFDFAGNPGRDVEVGLFSVVSTAIPEPASALVLWFAALVVTGQRRRRN